MHPLLIFAFLIGAVVLAVVAFIVFVHILPLLLGILAVCLAVKLYHWLKRPRDNRPLPRWPWRDS